MTFTNERISDEDRKRYGVGQIKRPRLYLDPIDTSSWTIDRDRSVFLIWTRGGDEDEPRATYFALSWRGDVVHAKLQQQSIGNFSGHVVTTWKLDEIRVPEHLVGEKDNILRVLKEALAEYKVGGIGVPVASHDAKFKF